MACASKIILIDFIKEEKLSLIINSKSTKIDKSTTRFIRINTQNIFKG